MELPAAHKRQAKSLRLREDMYSLAFVSLVKPQYKMYCDLVDKTGEQLPYDANEDQEQESVLREEDDSTDSGEKRTCFSKLKSFICFQAVNNKVTFETDKNTPGVKSHIEELSPMENKLLEQKQGWGKSELIETPRQFKRRQSKTSSLLGTVLLLSVT